MRYTTFVFLFTFTRLLLGQTEDGIVGNSKDRQAHRDDLKKHEVVVGTQVWSYSRIYPLLDGLLQDVAATQVSSLTLNPNSSNGISLDALQQSFQLQLQYSQMAGVQNAASAQVAGANANYQTQIAQQGAQLLQQFTQATALATQAQSNVNALTAASGTSAADIAAAQQVLTNANAQVTSLGTMLANLKSIPTATVPAGAAPLATPPTLPAVGGTSLPAPITTNATAATAGSPSFPATKQMDNQMALLWERLSRLVGVMAKPDSMPDDDIFLVKFDTGIYPLDRKKQLLDVSYKLSCGAVIDLFPRTAALNITEDKYRDTAFGLGAVVNFLGLGGSVAYNREHLRVSQLLGQSSYITGRGVGRGQFGWLFGISLGDDSISPGARTTFALVHVPKNCTDASVSLVSEVWNKSSNLRVKELQTFSQTCWSLRKTDPCIPPATPAAQAASWQSPPTRPTQNATPPTPIGCPDDCIKTIDFNRVEYDPAAGKTPVMMTIVLKQDMDQQQTVTVNGLFIPRLRDNFGRAVNSGGSSGVLEAQGAVAINTWIPASRDTMLLTLDAAFFNDRFPRILLSSPRGGPIDVSKNNAVITISGRTLDCASAKEMAATDAGTPAAASHLIHNSCAPSIGFRKSTPTNMQVARWIEPNASKPIDKLSITTLDAGSTAGVITASGLPSVQVISDRDAPSWGPNPEVYWLPSETDMRPLTCVPGAGSRLVCDAPDRRAPDTLREPLTLLIIDQGHPGGPIKGFLSTVSCDGSAPIPCRQPLLWKTNPPKLVPTTKTNTSTGQPDFSESAWTIAFQVVNVDGSDTVTLKAPSLPQNTKSGAVGAGTIDCPKPLGRPCTATFTIRRTELNVVTDLMEFNVTKTGKEPFQPYQITNILTNIKPWLSQVADDFTSFYGENLVYDAIRINGSEIASPDLQCVPEGTSCAVVKSFDSKLTAGLMYFVLHKPEVSFPFVKVNTTSANSPVIYTPKKPAAADTTGPKFITPLDSSLQLFLKKQEFTIQGFK